MLGFTLPYCDELLYSMIARHGTHSGIVSPKELLREVFGDAKIVATSDLPGHLDRVTALYPGELGITSADLLYDNTLFPLYAPFVGEERRRSLIHELTVNGKSVVHLVVGAAASRVKQPVYLRYCPGCMNEQMNRHGEQYWRRVWQVAGADSCPEHGRLVNSKILRHDTHRHLFWAAGENTCPLVEQQPGTWQCDLLAESIAELLELGIVSVPEFIQWSLWYRNLAVDFHLNRGRQVRHVRVRERVVGFWGSEWLIRNGLLPNNGDSCWLRNMFRKHRKAFSYLEHLIVLHAFLEPGWKLTDVVRTAVRLKPVERNSTELLGNTTKDQLNKYRHRWLAAVAKNGTKHARLNGCGDVYAWLYRRDRVWLMEANERHKQSKLERKLKVDWSKRDRSTVRELIGYRDQSELQLDTPRHSMNWYLNKLTHRASIEKHLDLLPLCRLFFERCCENIFEYQIRRITRTILRITQDDKPLKRWQVLRCSGLSEERLTEPTCRFLREILGV